MPPASPSSSMSERQVVAAAQGGAPRTVRAAIIREPQGGVGQWAVIQWWHMVAVEISPETLAIPRRWNAGSGLPGNQTTA